MIGFFKAKKFATEIATLQVQLQKQYEFVIV